MMERRKGREKGKDIGSRRRRDKRVAGTKGKEMEKGKRVKENEVTNDQRKERR